jgi:hypothetical protein
MKKLIFLSLIVLSGCRCLLSQIPPQFLYTGQGCEAPLPDYTPKVTATDNCNLASLIQTPAPGFLLGPEHMIANVVIKATDSSGNSSQVGFDVILVDTIPPVITADNTLLTADYDKIDALYNQADRIVKSKLITFDAKFPYAELGLTDLERDSIFYVVRVIKK